MKAAVLRRTTVRATLVFSTKKNRRTTVNYIGMDLHQKTTTWFGCDDDGRRTGSGKVDSNKEGWKSVTDRFGSTVQVSIETGSITWFCVEQLRSLVL